MRLETGEAVDFAVFWRVGQCLIPRTGSILTHGEEFARPWQIRPCFAKDLKIRSCFAKQSCLLVPEPSTLNSVSGLVSKMWYRIPFDQSELSISRIPPTGSPTVRLRRDG